MRRIARLRSQYQVAAVDVAVVLDVQLPLQGGAREQRPRWRRAGARWRSRPRRPAYLLVSMCVIVCNVPECGIQAGTAEVVMEGQPPLRSDQGRSAKQHKKLGEYRSAHGENEVLGPRSREAQ